MGAKVYFFLDFIFLTRLFTVAITNVQFISNYLFLLTYPCNYIYFCAKIKK